MGYPYNVYNVLIFIFICYPSDPIGSKIRTYRNQSYMTVNIRVIKAVVANPVKWLRTE
jgi:hypothetical protein